MSLMMYVPSMSQLQLDTLKTSRHFVDLRTAYLQRDLCRGPKLHGGWCVLKLQLCQGYASCLVSQPALHAPDASWLSYKTTF